jgi:hypothetical protein
MWIIKSEKGIVHPLLILVLLLVGVGIGTYLVQQRVNVAPKASQVITFIDDNGDSINQTYNPEVKVKLYSPWAASGGQSNFNTDSNFSLIKETYAYHRKIVGSTQVGGSCKEDYECRSGYCCTGDACGSIRYTCTQGEHNTGEGCRYDEECRSNFCCKDSSCGALNTCQVKSSTTTSPPTPTGPTPTGPSNSLLVDKTVVGINEVVNVSWSGISNPTSTDWIGIFQKDEIDNKKYLDWFYESCNQSAPSSSASSGTCRFNIPSSLSIGSYDFRMFSNNGYNVIAKSPTITMTGTSPVRTPLPTIPSNFTPQPSFFTPPPRSSSDPQPSSAPAPVTKRVILSSDQSFSFNTKIISPYDRNPFLTEYEFSSSPGRKTLYVKFISDTNEELVFSSDIELKVKINPADSGSGDPESSYDPNPNSDPDSNTVPNRSNNEDETEEYDLDAAPTAPPIGTPQFTPAPTQPGQQNVSTSSTPPQQTTQETNSAPSYYRSPSFERARDVRNDTVYEEDRAEELITDLNESNEGYPEKDDGNFFTKIIDGVVHFFTNLIN